jgi:hypothetical protein
MSDEKNVQLSYQTKNSEMIRVHTVQQMVDIQNLKIPQNLGTAAVVPSRAVEQVPASIKTHK